LNLRLKYYGFDTPSMAERHYRLEGRLKSYLGRIEKRKDILPVNKKDESPYFEPTNFVGSC
jgi:hypothetical protein